MLSAVLMFGQEIQQALTEMLVGLVGAIPKFITALVILIIGLIVANIGKKMSIRLLKKLNIDVLGQKLNGIDILQKNNIEIKLSVLIGKFIYGVVMLVFVMTAIGVLDLPVLAELIRDLIRFIPNLIAGFIILIFGLLLSDGLKNVVYTTCKSLGMPSASLISNFVFYFVFINILIVALSQASINTSFIEQNISIIIAGGVLAFSIGYGLASKDIVSSFLASFYTKDRVKIGDKVTVNGVTGIIVDLDKTSITIDTSDSKIIIPLSTLIKENIEIYH
ncbi:MAG: mechanosensitive ion channel [Lewinellaceae bacterium]|nr:mechanosensitive ion channel [Lewinellaceae bacterium]